MEQEFISGIEAKLEFVNLSNIFFAQTINDDKAILDTSYLSFL